MQAPAERAELACVVLSFRNQPGLVEAVRSVVRQEPRAEVVVVNSGGGGAAATLAAAGLDVPVVERQERLYPGAARNLGIEATEAPYVAFLASDCRAEPGWVSGRLKGHLNGAPAVATAITNPCPDSRIANAAYLRMHHKRMPETPPDRRLHYGASYDRRLFARFGRFREDLREGEDTEFNRRNGGEFPIAWSGEVRTSHRYPEELGALLRDQYARGRRTRFYAGLDRRSMLAVTLIWEPIEALRQAWRASDPGERRRQLAAWPLVPLAAVAFTAGLLAARRRPQSQDPVAASKAVA
jgi:glycosyltransferase involved in cell wall biosynthesis